MKLAARLVPLALAALASASPAAAQLLATGDPRPDGAVLWARAEAPGDHRFEVAEDAHFEQVRARLPVRIDAGALTAQAEVGGLAADTRYHWRLVRGDGTALPARASFVTAPAPADRRGVKLLFGADLGGQGYGRLAPGNPSGRAGWPIFEPMRGESADAFIALGDMLYSDRPVTAEAPDRTFAKGNAFQIPKPGAGYVSSLDDFRRDWHYHRSDAHFDRFLRTTPIIATWDDHELVNDSGGPELTRGPTDEEAARDARLRSQSDPARPRVGGRRQSVFFSPALYAAGRQAMFEWNPIPVLAEPAAAAAAAPTVPSGSPEARRLWRSWRWGAHAEVFMLDTRSHRDPRYRVDSDAAPKTMLGAAQKAWFKDALARSSATWKIVVSTVPLSIEGGNERDPQGRIYRDSWPAVDDGNPYGYRRELNELMAHIRERRIRNVVFLTGDQHFSNLFAYDLDGDGEPDVHEANIGALRAGPGSGKVDAALKPQRLYTDDGQVEHTYGVLRIEGDTGALVLQFHDVAGRERPAARLPLTPR
ncbi:MAG: alkaline phosphatase D family protein [Rubrivivax sp.]|nr:alkaline phosphatase D family protein [Rubrivivax sp.]